MRALALVLLFAGCKESPAPPSPTAPADCTKVAEIVKNAEGTADPMLIFGFAAVLATLSIAWWLVRGSARQGAGAPGPGDGA